jgi:WD40 repeat protein/transcriptional regulator with XRE-family HTH domain
MLVEEEAHMENQPKQASWAEILRKEREQRAWTQEEVAEELGIDARTIRNWESGTRFPGPKYRRELARIYEKSLIELKLIEPLISLSQQDNQDGQLFTMVPRPSPQRQQGLCMAKVPPDDFVARPQEFEALKRHILYGQRDRSTPITVALHGAGGYGKTTLAQALCYDPEIHEAFPDGILWVTLGEWPKNLIGHIEDLLYFLSGERSGFASLDAVITKLKLTLEDHACLLVLDDVWCADDLTPFLQGGPRCAHLITTRNDQVFPATARRIPVDAMRQQEAIELLQAGLGIRYRSAEQEQTFRTLASRLGEWPLLLRLANSILRERIVNLHEPVPAALDFLRKLFDKYGVVAFDAKNAQERSQAVERTLQVSLAQLDVQEMARYEELAIFPEDVDIPLITVQRLWQATGNWDELDTDALCQRLSSLSLLLSYDLTKRRIRLHDVVRNYLQVKVGARLSALHGRFLDAYGIHRWADLSLDEPYLWEQLAHHLLAAGRVDMLVETVKDLRYLATKVYVCRSAYAAESDVLRAQERMPIDRTLTLLQRHLANLSYLLNRCETLREIENTLLCYLCLVKEISSLSDQFQRELSRPLLLAQHPMPDLPHPALVRTLQGHTDWVNSCAVSPDGTWIVSASNDKTLKVWDAQSGTECLTLKGHNHWVRGCAVSPDGTWIVSASDDNTLKVWDAHTGVERFTLKGHTDEVRGCAVSPDGTWIVSASTDNTLKVWDAHSGAERFTLLGHTNRVNSCAVSPDGTWIVSASTDNTLKVWDAHSGAERLTLRGHMRGVRSCTISPDGTWIVSASEDRTLKVWDAQSGTEHYTLQGHTLGLYGCAISPDGAWIVSASNDNTLKVWDAQSDIDHFTFQGHTDWVHGCAVSPDGAWIVSASTDNTLKVWDAHTGVERFTLLGHTNRVNSCAVSPDSAWIVSASNDKTLKVWDAHTGVERFTLQGHTDWVHDCAVSPDGTWIVSASSDKTLKMWDAHTGAECLTLKGHTDWVHGCAVSPDGTWIVSASNDNTLKVWDTHTGAERFTLLGHTDWVHDCAVSSDGRWIVSASSDKTLKMWDAHTGAECLTLKGHTSWVDGCAISPDGTWIVSVSEDNTLRLWNVHNGSCPLVLRVGGFLLLTCAFSPDGEHLLAGGSGGLYFLRLVQ